MVHLVNAFLQYILNLELFVFVCIIEREKLKDCSISFMFLIVNMGAIKNPLFTPGGEMLEQL